jgi:hypothetical protein
LGLAFLGLSIGLLPHLTHDCIILLFILYGRRGGERGKRRGREGRGKGEGGKNYF